MTSDTRPDVLALAEALPRTHDAGPDDAAHLVALLAHRGWRLTQSPEPEKVGTAAPGHGRTLPPPQAPDESVGRLREALEKVTERLHSLGVPTGPWQECDRGLCAVANDALATTPQPGPISPARPVEPPDPDIVWLETDLLERLASKDDQIARLSEAIEDAVTDLTVAWQNNDHVDEGDLAARLKAALASQPNLIAVMPGEHCPTCGQPVRVVSADEGTSHYEAAAGYGAQEMEDAVGVLAVADVRNQRHIEALGAQVAALRRGLELARACLDRAVPGHYIGERAEIDRILNDTASAAAGYGLVAPWREALISQHVMYSEEDGYCFCSEDYTEHAEHCLKARALLSEPDTVTDKES